MPETNPAFWDKVTKSYLHGRKKIKALDNFTLTIEPGLTQGLLGANGSGKSTAVKLLIGLGRPDSGTVLLFGESPFKPSARKKLGFMPEIFETFPSLRTLQVLQLFARLKSLELSTTEKYIDIFRLKNSLDKKFKSLSRGLKQRVGLTQAFLGDPDLIILDEPTNGLDPDSQDIFYSLMNEREKNDKTSLIVTHRVEEVRLLCSKKYEIKENYA